MLAFNVTLACIMSQEEDDTNSGQLRQSQPKHHVLLFESSFEQKITDSNHPSRLKTNCVIVFF